MSLPLSKTVQTDSAVAVHFAPKRDDSATAESTRKIGKPALFRLGATSLSERLEQSLLGFHAGEQQPFPPVPVASFRVPTPSFLQYFPPRSSLSASAPA
ncbi:FKBP-type peptidyl-prolyl cis-trans isomerase, partial [Salmonella enterica]|uniref:FKBP-type peptidyl-prolyl cis-trans isomerase n=1 Tax=Salmonella enterica TaxID=28901 RepID=UPI00398C6C11